MSTALAERTSTTQPLTRHDRCQACDVAREDLDEGVSSATMRRRGLSAAKVRVAFTTGTLDFCSHHFEANEEALRATATEIIDQRGSDAQPE